MSDMAQGVTTEVQPEVTTVGGKVKAKTGDLIMDIAHKVEGLTKTKALNEAQRLADNIEANYLELGGVLKLISDNSWFEGFASFDAYVHENFGFQERKARYLVSIYDNLVTKQIPWSKVQHLGWTKLKDLALVLTPENVDEWVAKAENLTVLELQAALKASTSGDAPANVKTTSETTKWKVDLKADQLDIVTQAIAKAKGELHTDFDSVALENICSGYVGGVTQVAGSYDLDSVIKNTGFEPLLTRISELFPEYDINVGDATEATT